VTAADPPAPTGRLPRGARAGAILAALAALAAVLAPLTWNLHDDSFPLSTFPMFSGRKRATGAIAHVVLFSRDGRGRVAPPRLLGTDEIMQAAATSARAVRGGRAASEELCRFVAERAARAGTFGPLSHVEVRSDTYDAVAFFAGRTRPLRSRILARCVPEGAP